VVGPSNRHFVAMYPLIIQFITRTMYILYIYSQIFNLLKNIIVYLFLFSLAK